MKFKQYSFLETSKNTDVREDFIERESIEVDELPSQYREPSFTTSGNSKAKSIAEKLGFMNFDDDEFDTPSYMRREE